MVYAGYVNHGSYQLCAYYVYSGMLACTEPFLAGVNYTRYVNTAIPGTLLQVLENGLRIQGVLIYLITAQVCQKRYGVLLHVNRFLYYIRRTALLRITCYPRTHEYSKLVLFSRLSPRNVYNPGTCNKIVCVTRFRDLKLNLYVIICHATWSYDYPLRGLLRRESL